ncbi:Haloacid dehalogenase-like hydrolase [Candidatus Koribacter versatilis Ellin345]|uniref:Haloacid dehalogenase-like hydrolase n=1 Tax=Koribacter versatilis (strain Ellin345) TaxID=204669 RepID=Q1ILC1_KORVE|nr:HAD hydrolase-like protein [Candidatus Koribacter versatilis]ABF42329.1 Haloacid dehalogenase-like hydrolase [Candidatus Koribacter versatilis Ellin345]
MTPASTTENRDRATPPSGWRSQPQTLLIDADDTLWENNVYFERAIAQFISFLNHHEYSPEQVREVLNDVERENIVRHGYGLHSFAHALVNTFEKLTVDPMTPELHGRINAIAHEIAEHPVQLIADVPETLEYLAAKHHLIMVTKGDITEQSGKVTRSGLASYFSAVEIVAEKNVAAYHGVVEKYALALERTWMIGNSPKSDINPALLAGVNAIFIPHDNTWILEHEDVIHEGFTGTLLNLSGFGDLRQQF